MKYVIQLTLIFISIIAVINVFSPACKCEENGTNILYVGGSGDGNYRSIQDAIENSSDGDTIYVYAGIYKENVIINRSINLIGENRETTIITGKNQFSIILVNTQWLNISGLTIQAGPVSGIWIEGSENCNIYENNIINNSIGIYILESSNIMVFNNLISNNSITGLDIVCSFVDSLPIDFPLLSGEISVYHNNFINNTKHVNNNCSSSWSYNNEGNYYDDYTGLDKNNDGIGDTPYEIPGGDSVDKYPLMMPYDGTIRLKEFYVDYNSVFTMLAIGIIISIIFVLPIALWWRKKYFL